MLTAGTMLGPYRIEAPLGAGGMGEVYRARDTRLRRDVAVKVIPEEMARDRERVHRFEHEALASGALNHPNVITVFDVGTYDGTPYVVMELLEGESLRGRLGGGALPVRNAIDFAAQAARGLAAAHEKGVIHRDLKPENLFVTKDGRVKVLDFGLAKLTRVEGTGEGSTTLTAAATETGAILGTVGYMSPEQVRGEPADARSDLFALGAILYEMLSGRRAFRGDSAIETLNAILTTDPPALGAGGHAVPPALEQVVRRCLEKSPGERFESAHDVAFALEVASASTSTASGALAAAQAASARPRRQRLWAVLLGAAGLAALLGAVGVFLWGRSLARPPMPRFTPLTFQRGGQGTARFTPDGRTVIYFAKWGDAPWQLYSVRIGQTDSRPLGYRGFVKAIVGGEMAVVSRGVLSRMPIEGGTPRELVENVIGADWSRDGRAMAVVRRVGDSLRLEYPVGRVLLTRPAAAPIAGVHISPRGDLLAYDERPLEGFTGQEGDVVVMDTTGRRQVLSSGWRDLLGMAWAPDGKEIWFTATRGGGYRRLYSVDLRGRERPRLRVPGDLLVHDIFADGRMLLVRRIAYNELRGRLAGDSAERDLSWLDGTSFPIISPDGRSLVFGEDYDGGGARPATYLRRPLNAPPVRIAEGLPLDVSPDWKSVLVGVGEQPDMTLQVVPLGAGETRSPPRGTLEQIMWARWHPDGKRIVLQARERGGEPRLFVQELPDGTPRPFGPEHPALDVGNFAISPDGRDVATLIEAGRPCVLQPIGEGAPRVIPGIEAGEGPLTFDTDGRTLFVGKWQGGALVVTRIDLASGRRQRWLTLKGPQSGVTSPPTTFWLTPDGRYYAYGFQSGHSQLFMVEGLLRPRRARSATAP